MSSLMALLLPKLFKLTPRFRYAEETFQGMRRIMVEAIQRHLDDRDEEEEDGDEDEEETEPRDFIDVYLAEIRRTKDIHSSFYGVWRTKFLRNLILED